ncbi:hypothetical protein H2198_002359 [Neophaeococcomyces mojaviensis]|uniref:Uncharacterized protein n=1 Tax=Neophaeococcomyces mojaviensis TaxID=3383035 RepID=A0ACC3AF02_9EURO|nr:hypothetical protein H2198_002359 [Knufia sp. JES_112]
MARQGSNMSHELHHDHEQYNRDMESQFHHGFLHPHKFNATRTGSIPDPTDASPIAFQLDENIDPVLIGLANSTNVNADQSPFGDLATNLPHNFAIRSLPQENLHSLMIPSQSGVQSSPWINEYNEDEGIMNSSDLPQYMPRPNSKRSRIESGYGSQPQYSPSAPSSSPGLPGQQDNANFHQAVFYVPSQEYSEDGDSAFEPPVHNQHHLHPTSAQRGSRIHNEASPKSGKTQRQSRRQEKKYQCAECGSAKSFVTTNDRDRHMKTVHAILNKGDRIYICHIDNCSASTKIWPRLDNFKQHVSRMHGEQYADRAEDMWQEYEPEKHSRLLAPSRAKGRLNTTAMPSLSHGIAGSSMLQRTVPPSTPSIGANAPPSSQGFNQFRPKHLPRHSRLSLHGRSSLGDELIRMHGHYFPPHASITEGTRGEIPSAQLPQSGFIDSFGQDPRQLTLADRHTLAGPEVSMERMYADRDEMMQSSEVPHISTSAADFAAMGGGLSANDSQPIIGHTQLGDALLLQSNAEGRSDASLPDRLQKLLQGLSPEHGQTFAKLLRAPSDTRESAAGLLQQTNGRSIDQSGRSRSVPSKSSSRDRQADGQKLLRCSVEFKSQSGEMKSCSKLFHKKSELRKHEKRHKRIYGCTFDNCYKRFGTKWEWKRHEHKQHNQPELWRCQAVLEDGRVCAQIFHDDIESKKHLRQQHFQGEDGANEDYVNKFAKSCWLAKKWLGPYWCGFCKEIVKQSKNVPYGPEMVKERDIHVSSHIDRKTHVMHEWVEVQGGGKTKGQMQNPDDSETDGEAIDEEEEEQAQTAERPDIDIDVHSEMTQTQSRLYRSNRSSLTRTISPTTPIVQVIPPQGQQLLMTNDGGQGGGRQQRMEVEEQFNQLSTKICCNCGYGEPREQVNSQCPSCDHLLCNNPACGFQGWS